MLALGWDYEDVPRLVAWLCPPANPNEVERALRRIYNGFAAERHREVHENQPAKQVRRELVALAKALDALSPRTERALYEVLDDKLFLPWPLEQAQAVINPCRSDVPATRLSAPLRLRAIRVAVDHALEGLPQLRVGHPGIISDATRKAVHVLCLVYSKAHSTPYPTWDFFAEEVRNPQALNFAIDCLRAWNPPDAEDLRPEHLARCLRNYSVKN